MGLSLNAPRDVPWRAAAGPREPQTTPPKYPEVVVSARLTKSLAGLSPPRTWGPPSRETPPTPPSFRAARRAGPTGSPRATNPPRATHPDPHLPAPARNRPPSGTL